MNFRLHLVDEDFLTLQKLSLQVIADGFSRYLADYHSTENECLENDLHVLKKVYSLSLFQELARNDKLQENHLDFLLNEYLENFEFHSFWDLTSPEYILKKVIPIGHSLRELSFEDRREEFSSDESLRELSFGDRTEEFSSDEVLVFLKEIIPHAVNVRKIRLTKYCDDNLLKLIASSCPHLSELDVESQKITEEGLRAFYTNPDGSIQAKCSLRVLKIHVSLGRRNEIDVIANILMNMPTLEKVECDDILGVLHKIYQYNIDREHFAPEIKLNRLGSVHVEAVNASMYKFNISKILKICTVICPNLRQLDTQIFHEEQLELCSSFKKLNELCIIHPGNFTINTFNNNLPDIFFKIMGNNLRLLIVERFHLSLSIFIENCPNLELLRLSSISYQESDKPTTKYLTHLLSLELDHFVLNSSNDPNENPLIKLLTLSPNLKNLYLIDCELGSSYWLETLLPIFMKFNLRNLDLYYSDFGLDFLQELVFKCASLRTLCLGEYKSITTDVIAMLNHNVKILKRKCKIEYVQSSPYEDFDKLHHCVIELFEKNIIY